MGVQTFYCKGPHPLFVGWLVGRTWKSKNSGIPYCLDYCTIFVI